MSKLIYLIVIVFPYIVQLLSIFNSYRDRTPALNLKQTIHAIRSLNWKENRILESMRPIKICDFENSNEASWYSISIGWAVWSCPDVKWSFFCAEILHRFFAEILHRLTASIWFFFPVKTIWLSESIRWKSIKFNFTK